MDGKERSGPMLRDKSIGDRTPSTDDIIEVDFYPRQETDGEVEDI